MKHPLFCFTRLTLAFVAFAPWRGHAADEAAKRWAQYEPSFKAFAELDAANPPVKGGILFVGSSIFRQWTNVAELMAPLPVGAGPYSVGRGTSSRVPTRFQPGTKGRLPRPRDP